MPLAQHTHVAGGSIEQVHGHYDLLLNASTSSLKDQVPDLPASSWTFELVYDMMYGAKPTALMRRAQTYGIRNVDGLGMLLEQAAYAFLFWHGVLPSTATLFSPVRQAMRDH
jgi:shikimate dehydrogenase